MHKAQQKKHDSLYVKHVNALRRQGKADATIDAYSRAVRRIAEFFDRCPDRLTGDGDSPPLTSPSTLLLKLLDKHLA